ncbi:MULTISPECIES: ribonuclease J [Acetobacterium]|uniref:Ribonuclease J n=1 Tax=Acetobacterium wieringae TaxID=52694 RepID=A0A5D0WUU0_9FIRM|nr:MULTISPECIES: ribonuclease J [Acetobacterium]MEA4806801.1 ribonuclease J [Acetobacterium wieringae]OXS27355.1 MAG: ribonuclease J [Acetobacterium sp. MES1]TYC87959.1 ribonuclease J [Acetobacterium wieringae]URN86219.1 ribonuclease J [Acetobacterium wieringae]
MEGRSRSRRKPQAQKNKDKLRLIPLGGLGEIGKNLNVFEYKDDIILVDCGLKFPDDDMFGIDIVLPDFNYLIENQEKIKGVVITHGHEDHIGGLVYLLKKINIPIYATKFTVGLIDKKLKEHGLLTKTTRIIVKPKDRIDIGEFNVEFIRVNHSIADAVGLCIKCAAATVVHTGDFKIDYHPIGGEIIDLQRFAKIGSQGVDLLMSDSTNVEGAGFTPSESTVGPTLYNLFRGAKGRIIVTTFASNVHRLQQVIDAAVEYNRKVIICGRSMENVTEVAMDLGYMKIPPNVLVQLKDIKNYKDKELVIITTGSQGEPMAALGRMALGEHRHLTIKKEDMVIISASPVPGNEKMVSEVINKLVELGSDVVYGRFAEIHVSGHARQEELKLMITLVKPKHFLPVHGESRMLMQHAELAQNVGMNKERTFIAENGNILEIDKRSVQVVGKTQAEPILVDGLGVGDIGNIVLNDRKRLSEDGLFIVVCTMHKGKAVSGPDIISRGFVYVRESEELINNAREEVKKALISCEEKGIIDWNSIKNVIRESLFKYLYEKTQRKPMILPILMEV